MLLWAFVDPSHSSSNYDVLTQPQSCNCHISAFTWQSLNKKIHILCFHLFPSVSFFWLRTLRNSNSIGRSRSGLDLEADWWTDCANIQLQELSLATHSWLAFLRFLRFLVNLSCSDSTGLQSKVTMERLSCCRQFCCALMAPILFFAWTQPGCWWASRPFLPCLGQFDFWRRVTLCHSPGLSHRFRHMLKHVNRYINASIDTS